MSTITSEAYQTKLAHLADLKDYVGKELGLSDWYEIKQDQIDTFADVTEDHQWIHIDPERSAKYSPYKTTIAHGFLVLSLASKIASTTFSLGDVVMGVNYGLNRVRFTSATPSGAMIRGRVSLKEYKEIEGGARYIMDIIFELKGQEKPACIAEWVALAYADPNKKSAEAAPYESQIKDKPTTNDAVLYERKGKLAILTLNRPERYNAINHDLVEALQHSLTKARNDQQVKAVILTGNGKGFCAGADLQSEITSTNSAEVRDYLNMHYGTIIRRIVEMDKPVLCAINGPVAGAGIGFALACDFRVMAETANMRYAFINIGLGPDCGSSWLLARTVGYSKALEIAVEGEKMPAKSCYELGLCNKLVAADQLMETTIDWANKLAERPALGFAATKRSLNYALTNDLFQSIAYEAQQQMACLDSYDHKEGVSAFREKRKPKFIGK